MEFAFFRSSKAAVSLLFAAAAISIFAADVSAQATRQVTAIERRIQTMDQQSKQYEIDSLSRGPKRPVVDAKRAREIKKEIEEDLIGLQNAYNDVVIALKEKADPAEMFIRSRMIDVRKFAVRLSKNLALPKPARTDEKDNTPATDTPKDQMRTLAKLIYEVITNPIFESTSGLDAQEALRASRDLEVLIEFTSTSQ